MYENIIQNSEAFQMMLVSTVMTGNTLSFAFERDAGQIIDFIGEAYALSQEIVSECKKVILGDLMALSLKGDRLALHKMRKNKMDLGEMNILFDMKSQAMALVERINEERRAINPEWFDYSHYMVYNPLLRYDVMKQTASTGELFSNRLVGIYSAIGIGCEKNNQAAIERFLQCGLWGDIPSIKLLAYVYGISGNDALAKDYSEVARLLSEYMMSGKTELPQGVAANEFVSKQFAKISSIYYDVVSGCNAPNLNFSFIEAICSPQLSHQDIMGYINDYARTAWKEVTNPSTKPRPKLGF